MTLHTLISNKISSFLDASYYNNLQKLYSEDLNNVFKYCSFPVIKPEYFIYFQYYSIYLFMHYISYKKTIFYSGSLHLMHITSLIYNNLTIKYKYVSNYNIDFLKNTAYMLFMYLFYMKILLMNIYTYKKTMIISSTSIFYGLHILNNVYKERLECIEDKKEFTNSLKLLVVTPNKNIIKKVITYTSFFSYSNFLILINILLFFLL
jgi:hypothetical protein